MLCFKEVLVLSVIACLVSPKAVPHGVHDIFKLCKKPHFINLLHSTTTFPPPVDYSVTSKYSTVITPTTTEVHTTPEPVSPPDVIPNEQILYPPQPEVQHDPSQQQVYYPKQQYVVPYPQQQQVFYPPQQDTVAPYQPQEYVVTNLPKQEVVQNPPTQQQQQVQYPPQQQQDAQYPSQQQQDVQNPPPQQDVQYPPQQQQDVQYPPQQQQEQAQTPPQQQVQNSPTYYQGVPPFGNIYGPPEYYYQQQHVTNPFKKSLGYLINHKFSNDQRPYTAMYVQQPYLYDYYPTPFYYQLSQAHKKPHISHSAVKSKP